MAGWPDRFERTRLLISVKILHLPLVFAFNFPGLTSLYGRFLPEFALLFNPQPIYTSAANFGTVMQFLLPVPG